MKCEVRRQQQQQHTASSTAQQQGREEREGKGEGKESFLFFSFIKSVNIVTVCTTTLQYCTHDYVVSFKHRKTESDMGFN